MACRSPGSWSLHRKRSADVRQILSSIGPLLATKKIFLLSEWRYDRSVQFSNHVAVGQSVRLP
jgi:hypothetical protein